MAPQKHSGTSKNPRGRQAKKYSWPPSPGPRVVVKFKKDQCSDDQGIPYDERLEKDPETYLGKNWSGLAKRFPGITIQRLITSLSSQQIRDLEKKVACDLPSFLTYFAVRCPSPPSGYTSRRVAQEVARILNSYPWKQKVEGAYVEHAPTTSPGVILSPNESVAPQRQGHLDPSPDNDGNPGGVDARYAWGILGGDGGDADLQFIDIEKGWVLDHQDLPAKVPPHSIYGDNAAEFGHGTAVLGIVLADDNNMNPSHPNDKACVGISPHVSKVNVASPWRWDEAKHEWIYSVAEAILALINPDEPILQFGDVLLLEVQTRSVDRIGYRELPVEVQEAEFIAIKRATDLGIVVVEAAGNRGDDFDQNGGSPLLFNWTNRQFSLNPSSPHFLDSGAIIVGAAGSRTRGQNGNFGNRIDCYAWDDSIWTTGYKDDTTPKDALGNDTVDTKCYMGFGGTSGASAIIAGVALSLQGIAHANQTEGAADGIDNRFSPTKLRDLLKDPTTGTLSQNSTQANPNVDRIGVMPDLRKIIQKAKLVPDIYIRDFVGDDGTPHTKPITGSPDIILLQTPVQNPQEAYGEGSRAESDAGLSNAAIFGKDNYVYVRVRNRGRTGAENVSVDLYWARPAELVRPALWIPVGSNVTLPRVPVGDVLTVAGPITWSANQIPAAGQYCFVVLVGNVTDPAPEPGGFQDIADFERYMRGSNNVTTLNFNVV